MTDQPIEPAQQPTDPPPVAPSSAARENILRGTLLALVVVPAGVAVWGAIWSAGFIAAIVAFGVAWAAYLLYKIGSGGAISRAGAVIVLVIVVVTLVLAFLFGIVLDAADAASDSSGLGVFDLLRRGDFWDYYFDVLPDALPDYGKDIALTVVFGVLGAFTTLKQAFIEGFSN